MSLLKIEDLRAYYRTEVYGIHRSVRAVDGVSLELFPNEIYGIAGESSCGKTTLIKVISGTIRPPLRVESGTVTYHFNSTHFDSTGVDAVDMLRIAPDQLRRDVRWKEISYVMQGSMSVLNPVRRIMRTFEDIVRTHQGISDREQFKQQVIEHVRRLGLPADVLKLYPHQLSGGMRQRVAIALATIFHPSLIIADEPTTALDVTTQAQILDLMRELQSDYGMALLFITHDLGIVAEIADDVAVMYLGRIVERSDVYTIFNEPQHPYTQALLHSIPKIAMRRDDLVPIKGMVPSPFRRPSGCHFHPRCAQRFDLCNQIEPVNTYLNEDHQVRCLLYEDVAERDPNSEVVSHG